MRKFFLSLFVLSIFFYPFLLSANSAKIKERMETTGNSAGFSTANQTTLASNIGLVVQATLSLVGILFIVLTIISGYQWMTAGGNEEQVKKAQARIKNAIIGLVVVFSSYAIWMFIDEFLLDKV